jgi:hypothetical protein
MDNWMVKVEPEDGEQADEMESSTTKTESRDEMMEFESVIIKEERIDEEQLEGDGELSTTSFVVDEHPVKQEDENEQVDMLICGLPPPDNKILDQILPHDTGKEKKNQYSVLNGDLKLSSAALDVLSL